MSFRLFYIFTQYLPQLSVEKEYGHRRKDLLRITIIVSTAGNHPVEGFMIKKN